MLKFGRVVFGAVALAVSVGAAQLAVGQNLIGDRTGMAAQAQGNLINRAGKSDRPADFARSTQASRIQTLAMRDGTVVVRSQAPSQQDSKLVKKSKRPVACEPAVSVLTEVAQNMASSRCVT